ncbi:hypothetical protein [Streptomyces albipurpureus]|uniref:Uncharacterized protein n=1 Tax=Streptomyces albipurpureus TaxID=2897419 RepID=A0ABT0UHM3_9ACTN|nr:hypothetical protein [Streptomyces sp. CWNU-1]MCM2387534.1 hypothetical protein [Streptomyces sp. CWNU-1]
MPTGPLGILTAAGVTHDNARRVEELGIGREITDNSPDGITAVCREVLTNSSVGANTRRARLATLALPEIESAVADLEKLVD